MAILDAILKHADIRIAFLANAGDDEIGIGDEPDTGQLVASEPVISGNGINYFLHLELPPIILFFAFRQGENGTAGVCNLSV